MGRHTGFTPSQASEAMWDAMEQLRTQFDRKVGTRMGRGDVRAAVLALLHEEPMHGYQIIREITERTDGRWKPSAGSVYPTLQLLADKGLVSAELSADRKTYALTAEGEAEAASAAASAPWVSVEKDGHAYGATAKAGLDLAQAVAQMARTGTAAQQERATEILTEARRKIYSILAED